MKSSKLFYAFVALLLFFSSCTKGDENVKMIPKNALFIMHINTSSIASKLKLEEIKQTAWFRELYSDSSTGQLSKKIMDDPQSSGVDLSKDLVAFIQKPANSNGEIVIEGTINKASDFESFLKEVSKGGTPFTEGDIKMISLNDKGIVGWKGDKFAYITNAEYITGKIGEVIDSVENKLPVVSTSERLKAACKNLFALSDDASMAKVEKFSNLVKEKGDLHWWSNSEELVKTSGQSAMMGMSAVEGLLKGLISTATVDFNDGKIEMKQKMYAGDELISIFKKYGGKKIDESMIKNIPSKNVAAVVAFNFEPEGIKELIKLTGMDGLVNMGLSEAGITLDDFVKANKGDLLMSVSDLAIKQDTTGTQRTKLSADAHYLFAVSIGDKTAFNKLMDVGKKFGGELSESDIHNAVNDKYLAIGNNQQFVSGFIQGNNNAFDFTSRFNDHPIGVFVDVQKILTNMPIQSIKDSSATKIIEESKKLFENIYSVGGEYKDDGVLMTSEVNFLDKKTNSLKQLNQYFDIVYVEIKKQQAMKSEDDDSDNELTAVPDSMEAQ